MPQLSPREADTPQSALTIYSRISSKRDEFLNFLLLPNPEGIPAIEYAGLRVA